MNREIEELKSRLKENELMIQALNLLIDKQRLVLERMRERLVAEKEKYER
jgi:uncharacterized coiled-coil protein SlyX